MEDGLFRGRGFSPAALVLIAAIPLVYTFDFLSFPVKVILIVLSLAVLLAQAGRLCVRPAVRMEAAARLGRQKALLAAGIGYLLASWISMPMSGSRSELLAMLVATFTLVFSFLVVPVLAVRSRDIEAILEAVAIAGMAVIAVSWLLALLKVVGGPSWGLAPAGDLIFEKRALLEKWSIPFALKGPFAHPSFLGEVVICSTPGLLLMARKAARPRTRILVGLALLLCLLTLAASFSIIACIPFVLTLLGMTIFRPAAFHRLLGVGAAASVLFFTVAVLAGWSFDFLNHLPLRSETRVLLWDRAVALIHAAGSWGMPPEQAVRLMPYGLAAHNTVIETALLFGIAAMIFYSLTVLLVLWQTSRHVRDVSGRAVFYLVLATVVMQSFEYIPLGHFGLLNFYFIVIVVPFLLLREGSAPAAGPAASDSKT